jgi:hypothetical protein
MIQHNSHYYFCLPGILAAQAGASAVSISFCVAVAALVYAPRNGDTPNQPVYTQI